MSSKVDGNGKTILNLSVNIESGDAGLFTGCGLVSNLKVDGANISAGSGTAGTVVAYQRAGGVENVVVSNAVVSGKYVGGIVGKSECAGVFTGNIVGKVSVTTSDKYVGGIAGQFYSGDEGSRVCDNVLRDVQINYSNPAEIYGSVLGALINSSLAYDVKDNTAENIYTNGVLAIRIGDDTSDAYNAIWAPRRPDDKTHELNPNVTYANNVLTPQYVAQNVQTGEKYFTLAAALDAAQDGETVQLLADCETGRQYTIGNPLVLRAKNATLDLNDKTITATGNFSFLISGDNAIVKNGTIQAGANTAKNTGINSYAIVVNGCDGVKLSGLTVNGGVSVGGSTGDTPNAASATNVVIEDCTVTSGDYYAVCAQQNSTVTIASGSYTANTASSGSGILYASFVGTDGPKGTIYVTGGMFAGKIPSGNKAGDIVISGGVYSVEPDAKFCAVGYEVVGNTDGKTSASYPKMVAHKAGYIVENDNGEGYAVIPEVDSDWIEQNVKPGATTEEVEAALNAPYGETNLKTWEAYVLNQTESIKADKIDGNKLSTNLIKTPKDSAHTRLAVTYSLVKVNSATGAETDGTPSESKTFTLEEANGSLETGLYKVRVHFKSDASASEVTVDSENTVGVLKTQPTGQFVVVPVPFKELGGNDAPVKVASYIRSGLANGDVLHVYNGSNYDSWTYNGTSSSWEKTTNMTVNDENTASMSESPEPSVAALSRGTAAILRRAAGNTAPLVFVGDYTGAAEEQTIAAGWNLVASPSLEPFDPKTQFKSGKIQIPGDVLPKNYTFKNGKWGYSGVVDTPNGKMPGRIEVDTLPAGTGFWYFSDSQQTIEW